MRSIEASGIAIVVACGVTVVLSVVLWVRSRNVETTKVVTGSLRSEGRNDVVKEKVRQKENERVDRVNVEEEEQVKEKERKEIEKERKEKERKEIEKEELLPLRDPRWIKVGQIKELYLYPLKSGRGKDVKRCTFTEYGMSLENEGRFSLRDRMFLVYSEETGQFRTGRNYPTLLLVSLSAVDETRAKLKAVGMPDLVFRLPENAEEGVIPVKCTMWWGEALECVDCGSEVAKWISRFLTGTSSGLRVGYTLVKRRNVLEGAWKRFGEVYDTLRNEDTGLFADLASYMLMTESSVNELNQRLDRPAPALQFRPNIVITGPEAFAEDNWEWIKIGERTVIRNVKPCPSFRKQQDPKRVTVDGHAPTMGVYCGLYQTGVVEVGDDVFVHLPVSNGLQSSSLE